MMHALAQQVEDVKMGQDEYEIPLHIFLVESEGVENLSK